MADRSDTNPRWHIEIKKYTMEEALGFDLTMHDCKLIAERLTELMSSYQMVELIRDAARDRGIGDEEDPEDREDNPSGGLPLGSLALGAALGAAAMHFGMKPKQ
jgi:hypothetical protein